MGRWILLGSGRPDAEAVEGAGVEAAVEAERMQGQRLLPRARAHQAVVVMVQLRAEAAVHEVVQTVLQRLLPHLQMRQRAALMAPAHGAAGNAVADNAVAD